MILVQHGRGGWVNSRTTLAKAMTMAIAGVVVMLVVAGCSKTKPAPVGDANPNADQLNENTTNGTNTSQDWENGTVGRGGPLSDIHFGYNDYTINDQDGSVLKSNASWLQAHPQTKVQVEGYCDERGSEEYNIALGAKRAQAGKDYLATLGISDTRMSTISYGKELPLCTEHDESCWSQNRRDHFSVSKIQ
jgi:peptidoglycan-associated lipoprotein